MSPGRALLQVRDLAKVFPVAGGRKLFAVDGVTLEIAAGETLALVGESGSGKSTVARCILRLVEPTGGEITIGGEPMLGLPASRLTAMYRRIQMVFQDPNASLNPRMSIRQLLEEPLRLHLYLLRSERARRVQELIEMVGLTTGHLDRYPHELSGGQRQRIGIARAIAVSPEVVILDEPTSSLDVSVRGQVLDLLLDLQQRLNLAYLFITHDLQVVQHVADRVAVMYLGGIVEQGATEAIFAAPRHPYTQALLSAAPVARWGVKRTRTRLAGEISSPIDPPDACRLVGRCPLARPSCSQGKPALVGTGDGRSIACPVVIDTLPQPVAERIPSC
ncbi:MAG: ATP-binding cassette domain-containing protein [Proteobacteria bacterium]|nr:ATP-binding cassette domain-containing protein [Pseudomonadota bacterium]